MQKGNIGVTTENIFPVIKKFLYSDHEIFLRELVSNAVDATQKLKTFASIGEFKGELGDLTVHVAIKGNTIVISDRGIGLTDEEIDKYINQIAFSGANDFLEKYKNDANAIIGHFGLGFYSAFMVADKVEIVTKSYKENAKAVKWTCDGSPEFSMEETTKEGRGTDIILYIDDDCKEFLEEGRLMALLKKYCAFLPIPVAFGKKKEWKDGKNIETEEDNVINDVAPIWTKKPSELTDEDYKSFYKELYPMSDEPLFWIHLNVDYPFHLTGVLYFPKIKSNIELDKNRIQLYCNQVFVTNSVEGIVPDFLTLLHGVLDSPDIPLNVSRSYLQSDSNVKKISSYITKKVADRLQLIFKNDRAQFEEKWNDLKIFVNYGMLTQEEFYDRAKDFALFTDTNKKHYTFDEYKTLVSAEQTNKDGEVVYLYANNLNEQYSHIEAANNMGYNVLLMDGQLDVAIISMLEQKLEHTRFTRVDSDVVTKLIVKNDTQTNTLEKDKQDKISEFFKGLMPQVEKCEFAVTVESMGENASPVVITQSEYMRRMKDMSKIQAGMSFYGEIPDTYNVVLNSDHDLIKGIVADIDSDSSTDSITGVAQTIIDLALLQNCMLKGEELNRFIKKSYEMILKTN